ESGNTACAASAVIAIVTTMPTVLRAAAGAATRWIARHGVVIPPSNRITARPMIPTVLARCASAKSIPPGPSLPSSIPSPRKTTSTGTPARPASVAAATATSSTPPTIRISVPGSTPAVCRSSAEQQCEQRLLHVQAVLGLVPHSGLRAVQHLGGDLLPPGGGAAGQGERARRPAPQPGGVETGRRGGARPWRR